MEFAELGRTAFLHKYGFAPARRYFLLYRGGRYDSKAIAGAAIVYQHPDHGPLLADSFSGGRDTVARRLRELSFEITTTGHEPRGIRYWALCASPKRYRIRDAVRRLEVNYWTIGQSDIREGDSSIIWQTKDQEGNRGVVALLT